MNLLMTSNGLSCWARYKKTTLNLAAAASHWSSGSNAWSNALGAESHEQRPVMYTNTLEKRVNSDKRTTSWAPADPGSRKRCQGPHSRNSYPSRSYQTGSFLWAAKRECFLCRSAHGRWIRDCEDTKNRHGGPH